MGQRFLVNPLTIVTGYSHSIDAGVRQGNYLPAAERFAYLPELGRILFQKREAMKKLAALTLSIFLSYGTALADTPKDADAQPAPAGGAAKAAKAAKAKAAEAAEAKFAAELEELRQTLQSQQEQLQLLKEELAKRDRQIDAAREAAATANTRAAEASSRAAEAVTASTAVKSEAATLNSSVSDLKVSNEKLRTTVATAA